MTLLPARKSLTPTGDPNTYYNKGETDALLSGKASTDLTNLSSTGQMIIDTQNGTVSNCVLNIPQNIKLELSNNVLTLKSGSVITLTGSTYSTVTTTQDNTLSFGSASYGKRLVVFPSNSGGITGGSVNITNVLSGTTLPETGSVFFNTNDKLIYTHAGGEWNVWNRSYPICIVDCDSEGNVTFAKDSNGNDMIFNGACFVGHHAVVYPGVKCLMPNGFNDDGSLKSVSATTNSLQIIKLTSASAIFIKNNLTISNDMGYYEVESYEDIGTVWSAIYYVKKENAIYLHQSSNIGGYVRSFLIGYTYDGTTVTDFAIRQPVRTATVEMVDKKQNDITTITGYDATKTQTLKNVSGVLTWIDDE